MFFLTSFKYGERDFVAASNYIYAHPQKSQVAHCEFCHAGTGTTPLGDKARRKYSAHTEVTGLGNPVTLGADTDIVFV
jgi:hypothetical protein